MFKKNWVLDPMPGVKKEDAVEACPPLSTLLLLLKSIAEEADIQPVAYPSADGTVLRVQFSGFCMDIQDFIRRYGALVGRINGTYPVAISGQIAQLEEGTLLVSAEAGQYVFRCQSASGTPFDTLSHFYLKLSFHRADLCSFIGQVLEQFHLGQDYVALSRSWDAFAFARDLYESSDVLYFRYLPIGLDAPALSEVLPDLLSVAQITELWVRFLQGGASWVEFETVQDLAANGTYDGLYQWTLALKLAVEQVGITIACSEGGICATYPDGEALKLGYNHTTGAEKLFAKLISPA